MNSPARALVFFCGALVAAASIAACGGDKGAPVTAQTTMADSAEEVMWGVRHMMVEGGVKKAQLNADSAFIFDQHNKFELRGNVRMVILDSVGRPSATMSANQATYDMRRKSMEARGAVLVTTPEGKRLDTSHLVYEQQTNRIRSDSSFIFVEPNQRITGPNFITDPKMQFAKCGGGGGDPNHKCTYTGTGGGGL